MLGKLLQDLRYCRRMLTRRPSVTLLVVVTLALGIGVNTALFNVVNAVILNPFPYPQSEQLFILKQSLPRIGVTEQMRVSGPEFLDLAQSGIFAGVAAFEGNSRNFTGGEEPQRVAAVKVSADFFSVLGMTPELGRPIAADEVGPNGARVLVISHSLWVRQFGADRGVLGRKVYLDDEPFTVIGVMPPRFRFGHLDGAEAWFPLTSDFARAERSDRAYGILARAKSASSIRQTQAALATLAGQTEQAYQASNPEYAGATFHLRLCLSSTSAWSDKHSLF